MNPLIVPIARPDLGIYLPKIFPPSQGVAPGTAAVDKLTTIIQPTFDVNGTFRSADRPSSADLQGAAGGVTYDWIPPLTDPNTFAWIVSCSVQHDDPVVRYIGINKILNYPGAATIYSPLVTCSDKGLISVPAGAPITHTAPFALAFGNGLRAWASVIAAGQRVRIIVEYHILWGGQYCIPF